MAKPSARKLSILLWICAACETSGPRRPPVGLPAPSAASTQAPLADQVKQLAKTSAPGPKHAILSRLEGEWTVTLSRLSPSGEPLDAFQGEATLASVLGGRFLRWDASIDFGGVSGKTTGFLGFDGVYGEYELMMISDLRQGMEVARGSGDLQSSGIVFTLEQLDPATGAHVRARSRLRAIDHDHFVLEQFETAPNGEERVVRVSHYRRAAKR